MVKFKLVTSFKPAGDQPRAIKQLTEGIAHNINHQVLLGVTGSGKTFTIAKVIEKTQLPALVISHNKTLAGQLYQELKEFFPHNPVSYFVSYYDYYQPEAYLPASDTYIDKEVKINPLIEQLRLQATSNIFSFPRCIVVASVSCLYNIGSPETYLGHTLLLRTGEMMDIVACQKKLVRLYFKRAGGDFKRAGGDFKRAGGDFKRAGGDFIPGTFRLRGSRLDIFLAYSQNQIVRLFFDQQTISRIELKEFGRKKTETRQTYAIYPAKHYLVATENLDKILTKIKKEMKERINFFKKHNRQIEAYRIEKKTEFDLQMVKETGYVNGIENYSRYFDGRQPGEPPFTLVDYFNYRFKNNFLTVIDESHATIPQIRGMFKGDRKRKQTLIDFGFRLASSLDNRPLNFQEFLSRLNKTIYVSATPSVWEIIYSKRHVAEQIIRPTGLVDPPIDILPAKSQIENLTTQLIKIKKQGQRALVITLTKRMAEDLASFWANKVKTGVELNVSYLHSDIDTLKRNEILTALRKGEFDVLVGVNLLREGLDLPEVGLVAILEADKQGFLRSKTSLIQIMGRAARNISAKVILYADGLSQAIKDAVEETTRRRKLQLKYNQKHGLVPRSVKKSIRAPLIRVEEKQEPEQDINQLTPQMKAQLIKKIEARMRQFARELEFEKAVELRDKIRALTSAP